LSLLHVADITYHSQAELIRLRVDFCRVDLPRDDISRFSLSIFRRNKRLGHKPWHEQQSFRHDHAGANSSDIRRLGLSARRNLFPQQHKSHPDQQRVGHRQQPDQERHQLPRVSGRAAGVRFFGGATDRLAHDGVSGDGERLRVQRVRDRGRAARQGRRRAVGVFSCCGRNW